MTRCLVTGHQGYIGSRLFARLEELGHEVQGIDIKGAVPQDIITTLQEDTNGGFHPHFQNFKPEVVFHLACMPRVAYSVEQPVETMFNNVLSTSVLLNFTRKIGATRLIYSDSSSVMGDGDGPNSPYGLQKFVSELECELYSKLYGLDTVSLRYFNVYSPCQEAEGPYATAICNWMEFIRQGKDPFITGDGEQRRDMVHVEDVISANLFAMEYPDKFNGRHFDVGTGTNMSLNEVKDIIVSYFPNVNFEYREERTGDVRHTCANIERLRSLGWNPDYTIEAGLKECYSKLYTELGGE